MAVAVLKVNGTVTANLDTPGCYVLRNDLQLKHRQIRLRAWSVRRLHST